MSQSCIIRVWRVEGGAVSSGKVTLELGGGQSADHRDDVQRREPACVETDGPKRVTHRRKREGAAGSRQPRSPREICGQRRRGLHAIVQSTLLAL